MTERFEPKVDPSSGGTSLGNSYLSTWARCPRKWYNTYYKTIETSIDTSQGLNPELTDPNILTGSAFHSGMEAYYRSGIRGGEDTGEYDLDAGLLGATTQFLAQKREYLDQDSYLEDIRRVETMLTNYHAVYGPGGSLCDFPDIRILCGTDGEPLIEKDFRFDLDGDSGFHYTGRLDAIVLHHGQRKVMEHKATSAYGVRARLASLDTDSQLTGELWLLDQASDEPCSGTLVNLVLKDRSPNSKYGVAVRETANRTPAQLERWRQGVLTILSDIDAAIFGYRVGLDKGLTEQHASNIAFPDHGTRNGSCMAYNKPCEFLHLCEMVGMEQKALPSYTRKNLKMKRNVN